MATIKLPGLIDPHVHLRDPGQTEKEDFYTGTCAALAGGFTTILDMPNNKIPVTSLDRVEEKAEIAKEKIVCDVGFYFGSLGENLEEFEKIKDKVFGIKLYLDQTTGNYLINKEKLESIYKNLPEGLKVLVHAEAESLSLAIETIKSIKRDTHICHISLKSELEQIIKAKEIGLPITCGVTPHHLFLNEADEKALGAFGKMKPSLKSKTDVDFLWQNLKYIDVIESDHAPHTKEEKNSNNPPFGVPGLETTLPLFLTAVSENKLEIDDIKRLCHDNPAKIFGIEQDEQTYIEVDDNEEWTIKNENLFTKCKWSPFNNWKVKGKIKRVFIRGTKVFEDGKVLVKPGFGRVLKNNI